MIHDARQTISWFPILQFETEYAPSDSNNNSDIMYLFQLLLKQRGHGTT